MAEQRLFHSMFDACLSHFHAAENVRQPTEIQNAISFDTLLSSISWHSYDQRLPC